MVLEGLIWVLRLYWFGDFSCFIYWCSSVCYGELWVWELEVFRVGEEILICFDSVGEW